MQRAYIFSGLPGAGKTTGAEIASELTGGEVVSSGNVVRSMWYEHNHSDPTSTELGEFAAKRREQDGPAFFAEWLVGKLTRGEKHPRYPLIIDGVRHADSIAEFREYFDDTYAFWVAADSTTRLQRLQDRGRDGEDTFDQGDLLERDRRELQELGVQTIRQESRLDEVILNDDTEGVFRDRVSQAINTHDLLDLEDFTG